MPLGIEVGMVVGGLEVLAAEVVVLHADGAVLGVKDGNAMATTDLADGLDDGFEARATDVPRGDESNLGPGVLLTQTLAEQGEGVAEHAERVAVVVCERGIVVPGNDQDNVGRVRHFGISLHHAWAETLAVPCHAGTVAAIVAILESQLLGRQTVPRLLLRATVVGHITVAEYDERLSLHQQTGKAQAQPEYQSFHFSLFQPHRRTQAPTTATTISPAQL